MKKLVLTMLLMLVLFTGCRRTALTSDSETSLTPTSLPPANVAIDDLSVFRDGLIADEQSVIEGLEGASVYHIDMQLSDDFRVLQGHEVVRYTNQEDVSLAEIYFRLFANTAGGSATVSNVKVDGQEVDPVYELLNSAVRIDLPEALSPGEQVVIDMDFIMEIPTEMGGNYGLFGYFEDVLVLDEAYPVIPVYDDEGWNVEVPPPNGDVTYFDSSFYLVRFVAPVELTVVASGVEIAREVDGNLQTVTHAAGPARDFYIAASEQYMKVSQEVGETTINSYAIETWSETADVALKFAVNALKSFSTRFGPYPYTEFDVVSTPMQAGGMEYPGVVAIALDRYDPDAKLYGAPSQIFLESTIAHEAAHQWFYNVVGNDQIDEPWLDEAVVQYATGLYYEDVQGSGAARSYRSSWYTRWDRVERADIPIGLPTGAYEGSEYGAIVYGRGPIFVRTLAKDIGQETFDAFLKDYYQTHKWGIGTGVAFMDMAEQHCACDLTALFDEWVYDK